jgi:mono/diheme cytochrome c family protein
MQVRALCGWLSAFVCGRSSVSVFLWIAAVALATSFATTVPALSAPQSAAADSTLTIVDAQGKHTELTAKALLARPDSALIDIRGYGDIYRHSVAYHAVPLLSLLTSFGNTSIDQVDTLEAEARDGFASQIPLSLIARGANGGSVAWIAIEDQANPWPPLPHEHESAGPFYLVWEHPERSGIGREQWPYKLTKLTLVVGPVHRWPQLAVEATVPAGSSARRGQDVFILNCLPCHRMKGGGASETGPDLGQPMPATQYLTDVGLRAIIRDPASVRVWPDQHMIGFSQKALSDADLDALVAYLHAMSGPAASGR